VYIPEFLSKFELYYYIMLYYIIIYGTCQYYRSVSGQVIDFHNHFSERLNGTFTFTSLTFSKNLFMKFGTHGTHSTSVYYYYTQTYGFTYGFNGHFHVHLLNPLTVPDEL
jgi:hypothetical protein